jgi:hypothetical protein
MSLQLSVTVRNARLDVIEAAIGTGARLRFYTGSMPASCATAASGNKILEDTRSGSAALADFARGQLAEGELQNIAVLGRSVPYTVTVDGAVGAAEDNVRPNGEIVYDFELVSGAVAWVCDQLVGYSPIGSGRDRHPGLYAQSHTLFADGSFATTATVSAGGAAFVAGTLALAFGSPTAGNNKVARVASSTATTIVFPAATLTAETVPSPIGASILSVGFQGVSKDLATVIAGGNGLTSTTLDLSTLPCVRGCGT